MAITGPRRRRVAVLRVARGEQPAGVRRLGVGGVEQPRDPVRPCPPQRGPVVLVVVGEQRDRRVVRDVPQPREPHRRLRLDVVDRAVDPPAVDGEDDRDEVRAAVGARRREARDAGGGESRPCLGRVHGRNGTGAGRGASPTPRASRAPRTPGEACPPRAPPAPAGPGRPPTPRARAPGASVSPPRPRSPERGRGTAVPKSGASPDAPRSRPPARACRRPARAPPSAGVERLSPSSADGQAHRPRARSPVPGHRLQEHAVTPGTQRPRPDPRPQDVPVRAPAPADAQVATVR